MRLRARQRGQGSEKTENAINPSLESATVVSCESASTGVGGHRRRLRRVSVNDDPTMPEAMAVQQNALSAGAVAVEEPEVEASGRPKKRVAFESAANCCDVGGDGRKMEKRRRRGRKRICDCKG